MINGPNLNMLGSRSPEHYGNRTLSDIETTLRIRADNLAIGLNFFQSNHEGDIVDFIQTTNTYASGIIINAGALTHYSLSVRDALVDTKLPIVEIHLSNIHGREPFRRHSVIADIADVQIAGLGWAGYLFALEHITFAIRRKN
mgnify:CR=1 FL=1